MVDIFLGRCFAWVTITIVYNRIIATPVIGRGGDINIVVVVVVRSDVAVIVVVNVAVVVVVVVDVVVVVAAAVVDVIVVNRGLAVVGVVVN